MEALLQLALTNAAMALLLAVPAAAAGLLRCRPALVHGLWLLVLLKLITPPLVSFPVPSLGAGEEPHALLLDDPMPAPPPGGSDEKIEWLAAEELTESELPALALGARQDEPAPVVQAPREEPALAPAAPALANAPRLLATALLGLWAAGSVLFVVVAIVRSVRFRNVLKHGTAADAELDEHILALADRLGLRSLPEARLVPGAVSPMIWGLGRRACLLIPAELFGRLDPDQRDALLLHELAHLRRGDHWVRLLELAATGVFWWHPVVWWARHALHEAEEQCCDAWVVWALPGSARAYAEALLETVDFLSEARAALPPAASGIGQVRKLKRRLTMIMQANTPRTLSVVGFVVLFCLGVLLLPLVPHLAQAQPPADVKILIKKLVGESNENQEPEVQRAIQVLVEKIARAKSDEEREAAINALTQILRDLKARQGDRAAGAREKDRDAQAAKQKEAQIAQVKAEVEQAEARLREAHERLMQAHRKLADLTGAHERIHLLLRDAVRVEPGTGIRLAPGARPPEPGKANREERLEMLEKQLAELLREVRSLKEEKPRR